MNILAMETSIFDREDHSPYLSLISKIVFYNYLCLRYHHYCPIIVHIDFIVCHHCLVVPLYTYIYMCIYIYI